MGAAYKPVIRLFRNESKDWTGVTVNGEEIVSTPGHKYFLPETKEWISAENLKVGTKVLLSDGSCAIIEAVRAIHYDEPQTTYNFEVEDFHTYYVGTGVLVHNRNCNDLGKAGEKKIATRSGMDKNTEVFTPKDFDISQNRIPDFMTKNKLIEVKNVARQSLTSQLRDYLTIARTLKIKPILYVRPNTVLSSPLKAAGFIIR